MSKMGHKTWQRYLLLVFAFVCGFLLVLAPDVFEAINKAQLRDRVSCARQIHIALQSVMLDEINTAGIPVMYPADAGIKTNLEYITYLVKNNVFKESDLPLFCRPGMEVTSLKDLRAENIVFRFANLSSKDKTDSEMIFLVSNGPLPQVKGPWYFFKQYPFKNGYVVFEIGGDGAFYTQPGFDIKKAGHLPPRDPPFLE